MTLRDLKYVNSLGGIQATRISDGIDVYLAPDSIDHGRARRGDFGTVREFLPPVPTLNEARATAIAAAREAYVAAYRAASADYTQAEINTFARQEAEASAYLADPQTPTPFLDGYVAAYPLLSGRTEKARKTALAKAIMAKVAEFESTYSGLLGNYKNNIAKIMAASTMEEIDAIDLTGENPR